MSAQARPILTLLSGNLLGTVVGGAFFLAASWRFGLDDMGRYAVAISAQWVAFGLIGPGMATTTLRFAGDRFATGDRPGAAGVVAGSALTVSGAALLLALVCYGVVNGLIVSTVLSPALVATAVLWGGARALLDCLRSGLLAQQDFARAAMFTAVSAATGLAALLIALLPGDLSVERLLAAHVAGLLTGALAGLPLLGSLARDGIGRDRATTRAVFAYARWPSLSEGTRLLQANLGAPCWRGSPARSKLASLAWGATRRTRSTSSG
jgi:O-antigen/teichoic acid export membrane protein